MLWWMYRSLTKTTYGVIKVSAKGMRGTCIEGDDLFSPLTTCRKSSKIGIGKPVGTVVFADISEV